MKTDITGIAKNFLQVKNSLKTETASDAKDQKLSVSFFELMSQNTLSSNLKADSSSNELVYRVESKGGNATQTAYGTCANPVKSVSVKEDVPPEEILSEGTQLLEEYEEEIRTVLKEQFGVTDEQIDEVLEILGINLIDLGNIQDLTAFVQKLTGETIGALFLSEAFQEVKNQIMEATETLCAELGITKEEWNALTEVLSQQMQPAEDTAGMAEDADMETLLWTDGSKEAVSEQDTVLKDIPQTSDTDAQTTQTAAVAVQETEEPPEETIPAEQPEDAGHKTDVIVQKNADVQQQAADAGQDFGSKGQETPEQMKSAMPDTANEHAGAAALTENQAVRTEQFAVPQETAIPYASQVDAIELIEQIARQVRVTVSSEMTSMEMQLNPESLGKIYLNISEKEGTVRAQIAAQNQVVKEALETQVAELRQTLNQQGIKVDAIEVTIASHEFEQNLEENARQEEQMRQQMEESQKKARRSLNLSELDDLSGLMTEEEQLVAQIMRDNGNQVDLTA